MDSLGFDRSPGLSAADFPPFMLRAPWWGGDLQTLRNYVMHGRVPLASAERIYLRVRDDSGDRLAGALHRPVAADPARPLVVLIHGLTGCERSHYVVRTAAHLLTLGYRVLRLNLRGAGASRPHCRFQYYAGRSEDFADALAALPRDLTGHGVVAIGFSLGANMLLKYLGERGSEAPLKGAIAISAPLDLAATARQMMRPRNHLYQRYLLRHMRAESLGAGAEVTSKERAVILGAQHLGIRSPLQRAAQRLRRRRELLRAQCRQALPRRRRRADPGDPRARRSVDPAAALSRLRLAAQSEPHPAAAGAGRPCRIPRPRPHPLARPLRDALPRRALIRPSLPIRPINHLTRHCEERSDEAIQGNRRAMAWIASLRSQ
jgi:pimeloyl-ACP methyl ester carboxylesterase